MHDLRFADIRAVAAGYAPSAVCGLAALRGVAEASTATSIDILPIVRCDAALQCRLARALAISPTDLDALHTALRSCSRPELRRALLEALAPSVAERLPAAVWQTVLAAGLRAERLAALLGNHAQAEHRFVAMAAQLAVHQGDPPLQVYRDGDAADFIGAPLAVRLLVCAVAPAEVWMQRAELLLGLPSDGLRTLAADLPAAAAGALTDAGLPTRWDEAEEAAAEAELGRLLSALPRAGGWRAAVDARAELAAQRVASIAAITGHFGGRCVLLRAAPGADHYDAVGDATQLTYALDHARSRIAAALRAGAPCVVDRAEATAYVDLALFDLLASDQLCVALGAPIAETHVAVVLPPQAGVATVDLPAFVAAAADEWAQCEAALEAPQRVAGNTLREAGEYYDRELRTLAHEVSNPLAIIGNYVHLFQDFVPVDERRAATYRDYLQQVSEELLRAVTLLREATLRPALGCVPEPAQAIERAVTGSANNLLRALHGVFAPVARARSARLEWADETSTDVLIADAEAVRQVLVNLLRNALDAVPTDSGVVRLRALPGQYRDGQPHVVFEVRDNGPGVPAEMLAALAQPKRSTGGGAGMGLAIAHRLARERLQGGLDVEASTEGTVFRLWVPAPH